MDSLTTHPSTAQQASAFTAPSSLSFPGGHAQVTPPSEKDGSLNAGAVNVHKQESQSQANGASPTPAATPAAGAPGAGSVSGVVPTLQNIVSTVSLDCRLDLKTIALHARNAEYNPKVSISLSCHKLLSFTYQLAFRRCYHAHT